VVIYRIYQAASLFVSRLYMLDHCDRLIAVWDGLPARGPGGAGQIVEQARRQSIPVIWVKVPFRQHFQ